MMTIAENTSKAQETANCLRKGRWAFVDFNHWKLSRLADSGRLACVGFLRLLLLCGSLPILTVANGQETTESESVPHPVVACGIEYFPGWMLTGEGVFTASAASGPTRTEGIKTLLYMRLTFVDDTSEPISFDAATAALTQMNQVFSEFSYQKIAFNSVVTPLLSLPRNKADYTLLPPAVLLSEARAAALQVGFNPAEYDFDVARFRTVPGWTFAGLAITGGKGVWLQSSSVSVVVHEVGHNLGLEHANFWSVTDDSIIGHGGSNLAYGNIFDTMGLESSNPYPYHFNVVWKNRLNWLTEDRVQFVSSNSTVRLDAFDGSSLETNRVYAINVTKDLTKSYWLEFRQRFTQNSWAQRGVILNWSPWSSSGRGTQLLDTTPGTPSGSSGREDSPLTIGRTFTDAEAGVHITPLSIGQGLSNRWIDVQVNLGSFAGNVGPTLEMSASASEVPVNSMVSFSASSTDSDGDSIAYHWDFGDLSFGSNSPSATKSWSQTGEYLVRCIASDMKGGLASRHVVVRVGSPNVFRIEGSVRDPSGIPVQGVRIHNGLTGAAYRGSYTDSDGHYILPNLGAGSFSLVALKFGYILSRDGWSNPIAVGPDATNANFVAVSTATNPPTITGQPQSQLVTITSNATFAVTATGTPPLRYQWYFNGTNAIAGATNSVLTIPNVQDVHAGAYSVVVSNVTSVTSSNAVLRVNHPPVAPAPLLERFAFYGTKARVADFLGSDPEGDGVTLLSVGPATTQGGTVVTNSGWVVYTPPAGFTNSDSFPFVLSDGRGGISQGTAAVNVTFDNVVPQNLRAELLGDGSVRLTFDGIPGRTYSIEFTDDLENPNWQILGTALAGETGIFTITDLLPPGAPQRFYRATWP